MASIVRRVGAVGGPGPTRIGGDTSDCKSVTGDTGCKES